MMGLIHDRYCDNCGEKIEELSYLIDGVRMCEECYNKKLEDKKIITNGDRIRQMSNKELAEWNVQCGACPAEYLYEHCPNIEKATTPDICTRCWLQWLNAEYKTEDKNK